MSIIIKSKRRIFGECFNTNELLQAVKNPLFFSDEGRVTLSSMTFHEDLTMIFICQKCSKLHLVCGKLDEGHAVSKDNITVFADHISDEKFITKKELIEVLEHLQEIRLVCLQHIYSFKTYTLTEINKCHEDCPSVHLDSGYSSDCVHLN